MNESAVFYRSFYEAIRLLPEKQRLEAYDVVMAYAIDGEEPEECDPYVEVVFTLIKPQIDANNKRRSDGGKGGRPSHTECKNEKTSGYANEKPVVIETENQWFPETETSGYADEKPNVNVNANVNVNENVNGNSGRFTPPSITDVQNYADSKGLKIDAERFVDFYSSKGWTVGKSPMKDWRAAVRNWCKSDRASPKKNNFTVVEGRDNSGKYAALESALLGRAT